MHESGTAFARNRDVDRENERTNEGARQSLSPLFVQGLIAQVTEAVLRALQLPSVSPATTQPQLAGEITPPALTAAPPPPPGAEPLPAPVLALWQGDARAVSQRELHQLAMLAAEIDGPTNGHGAYWLGRAILMADLCRGERGETRSLPYLRGMLRRWRDESSWGSDREPAEPSARATATAATRPRASAGSPGAAIPDHPAVVAYIEALHEAPNAVQAAQIAQLVTNLAAWREVLREWQLNGWGERSVGKMLDRYQKSLPAPAAGPPPSVAAIHHHPGLSDTQRDRWIRAFHAAANSAEKHAVIARLAQEHPR
jgi:hypothetical protein